MKTTFGYQAWYDEHKEKQAVEDPIEFTLGGIEALLRDKEVDSVHKAAAREFLKRTQRKTWASNTFALVCALGAAFSSIAYFMAIRDHNLAFNEYLIAPGIVGLFVAAATWYSYRHDTAEWFLDFSFDDRPFDSRRLCVIFLTAFIVAMEVALSGYGIAACLHAGTFETVSIVLVCAAALIPEWAQTYKYLDKWITGNKEKYDWSKLSDKRFAGYMLCSVIMLTFSGMAIFPLLEDTLSTSGAIFAVAGYVGLGLPYLWKKAEEQMIDDNKASPKLASSLTCSVPSVFTFSRVGSGLGDLAFSAYGFFETMKALGVIKKPADTFDSLGADCADAWKPWLTLIAAVCVVGASCVGSYLMTAKGDQESYGVKIARAQDIPIDNKQDDDMEAKPPPVIFSSMWHTKSQAPAPAILKKPTLT